MNSLNQHSTPLFDAVINYAKEQKISFHTPGHKHGVSIPQEFRNFVGEKIFDCDLTLLEEVDSLHYPCGVIKEALKLAAEAYGSDYAFFLVNGTSGGNHIMILTVCEPGDKIIVSRNTHRSVLAGIILSGAVPVYVMPEIDEEKNIFLNVSPEAIARAVVRHPDAKAVLVTHPTYQGIGTDLRKIAQIAHQAGMYLLVDEAHGPHLKFHPDLPMTAMASGADICVQSTHKIISSMTQASLMLVRRTADVLKLKRLFNLLQTTSPSYILLTSLDLARMQMATRGKELLTIAITLAQEARCRINAIPGLSCFGEEVTGQPGAHELDVTKLCVDVKELKVDGYQVAGFLNEKYKIQIEFADLHTILLIVTIGNTSKDMKSLVQGLEAAAQKFSGKTGIKQTGIKLPSILPEVVLPPREAVFALAKKVPWREAVGEVSAEIFSPYPPGIPLLCPGERLSAELVDYLRAIHLRGRRIKGLPDSRLGTIKVVENTAKTGKGRLSSAPALGEQTEVAEVNCIK